MSIGQRISDLRKAHSYSQEYVAEKLGVSRQAVSKWETDTSAPDTYNLIALAELFDVSVEYIATGKQPEQPSEVSQPQDSKHVGMTTQKIVGFILLGAGAIALAFGFLWSELLILLSLYLLIGGILCLAVRKRVWFVVMWTDLIFTFLLITVLTTQNLFCIFNPKVYQDGFTMGMIVSYVFWVWLTVAITITVTLTVKNKKGGYE